MVICLEWGADLYVVQLIPLPLTVPCFSKSRLILPFWYQLAWVVADKGLLKGIIVIVHALGLLATHGHLSVTATPHFWLPKGLYIFVNVFFFNFFNGQLSRPDSSESNGPIFTKISGLVDGCEGLLTSFSFLRSLKRRCHDNQLK